MYRTTKDVPAGSNLSDREIKAVFSGNLKRAIELGAIGEEAAEEIEQSNADNDAERHYRVATQIGVICKLQEEGLLTSRVAGRIIELFSSSLPELAGDIVRVAIDDAYGVNRPLPSNYSEGDISEADMSRIRAAGYVEDQFETLLTIRDRRAAEARYATSSD